MRKVSLLMLLFGVLVTGCAKQDTNVPDQKSQVEEEVTTKDNITRVEEKIEQEVKENNIIKEEYVMNNEEEVIKYFRNVEEEINKESEKPLTDKIKERLKNTFITITDFLFYDGTIGGVTFKQLSEETKLEILKIAFSIDNKIESKIPGYKESIKTTTGKVYQSASTKIKEGITSIDEYLQKKMSEKNYQAMQDGATDLKDGFIHAGEAIMDAGSNIKDKMKKWYENFRK